MIKFNIDCTKCHASFSTDDDKEIEIDISFHAKTIIFLCPLCGHLNQMDIEEDDSF